jgi:hypothetical protein
MAPPEDSSLDVAVMEDVGPTVAVVVDAVVDLLFMVDVALVLDVTVTVVTTDFIAITAAVAVAVYVTVMGEVTLHMIGGGPYIFFFFQCS